MLAIDLCDEVQVLSGVDKESAEPPGKLPRSGLTDRALSRYFEAARIDPELEAGVRKTIPVAAGLGGGSSNAAIVLAAANQFEGRALSEPELAEVAGRVGSDVPFFLQGGCALVSGRGEIRQRDLPVPQVWTVLANPGVKLSTPDVFGELRRSEFTSGARTRVLAASIAAGNPRWDHLHNGLQAAAERLCPSIREVLAALRTHTSWTLLSGSGSTCFGVFDSKEAAIAAEQDLAKAGYWSWAGRPLGPWAITDLKI